MKVKVLVINLVAIGIFLALVSCNNRKGGISPSDRLALNNELKSLKSQLPYELSGTGVYITSIEIGDSCIEYSVAVPEGISDLIFFVDSMNTDRNVSRVILGFGTSTDELINKNIGILYRYEDMSSGQELCTIEVGPKRLRSIMSKLKSGEIKPYTMLEMAKMQISNAQYPIDLGDGLLMTNIYIDGNNICYEYTSDTDVVMDKEFESIMKKEIVDGIKDDPLIGYNLEESKKENIHLVYIYKNKKEKILSRIDIDLKDVK